DIKPANVIITHSGAVKVMDFGIARALHGAQSTMTQTGMVMGTPQYLSPEQALGKAVDHRSDLYATGCLLYELLALRPPFTGETPLSVVYQHVQDIPVPPSQVAGAVPPELDGLVMRSLAKEPDDRFQSAEEMRGLVQYSLQMLQVQGGHTGTWNTGPVNAHDSGHTAAMNIGGGTAAMGHPMHGDTSQGPILPPMNPDDGAYAGGHRNGGGRGKMWLFVLLALIAIGAGVAVALQAANGDGGNKKSPTTPSATVSPTPTPSSPEPTDEETEETEEPDDSTGGQNWPTDDPTFTPTQAPTEPTDKPSETPTTADPGTGGTSDGGTSEGDDEGSTGEPTDDPTDPGTSEGGSAGTPAGAAAGTAAGPTGTTGE
ncbi:protein kinase, partial [Streptomyces sp. NPDC060209]|uniref:protein kinase domain-containing protein n=1 Tax=Streptomyces sp. NPDC060209 TaxID=3347073 RepID=UPI00364E0F64